MLPRAVEPTKRDLIIPLSACIGSRRMDEVIHERAGCICLTPNKLEPVVLKECKHYSFPAVCLRRPADPTFHNLVVVVEVARGRHVQLNRVNLAGADSIETTTASAKQNKQLNELILIDGYIYISADLSRARAC